MRYRVLYLGGSSRQMTLPVLRKIRDLVKQGAVVVGGRPTGSPSLADNPAEIAAIADELWAKPPGNGRVLAGSDVNQALALLGVVPDFDYTHSGPERDIMFVHRHLADGDIYFLSNRRAREHSMEGVFRVSGKRPELWHADTGQVEPASYRMDNGRTTVPLHLGANESVFVVFLQPAIEKALAVRGSAGDACSNLGRRLERPFLSRLGRPRTDHITASRVLDREHRSRVKYYSGTAAYTKRIEVPAARLAAGQRVELDLGDVRELAEVSVNGRSLGIVWHPPYKVDVTSTIRGGANTLVVKVTNLWWIVSSEVSSPAPGNTRSPSCRPAKPTRRFSRPVCWVRSGCCESRVSGSTSARARRPTWPGHPDSPVTP